MDDKGYLTLQPDHLLCAHQPISWTRESGKRENPIIKVQRERDSLILLNSANSRKRLWPLARGTARLRSSGQNFQPALPGDEDLWAEAGNSVAAVLAHRVHPLLEARHG
jgi:hypothetical protein